jgi:hypothetical protein
MTPDPGVILTNGHGEEQDAIDLASQVTAIPPRGELGSAYDRDRLFTQFDDGKYFATRDLLAQDFDEMLRADGKARTLEQVLTLPLMSAEASIEKADGDSGEAEYCREVLERPANAGGMSTPLDLVIGQMTSAVVMRRAFFEKVFEIRDGRVRYSKLAFRPARTCYMLLDKRDYSFKGIKQRFLRDMATEEVVIPPQKSFVYIHGQHRDPVNGTSALETAWSIWQTKQKIRFLWGSFLENQVLPKATAKDENTRDASDLQRLAERVATLKSGGVVGLGQGQSLDALSTAGNGGTEYKQAMDYLDSEMSGSVLAGFTDLTSAASSGRGSYALSESAIDFFGQSVGATLKEMAASLTSWVLADLVMWNFGTSAAVPTFKFGPPAREHVEKAFDLLQALATTTSPTRVPPEFIDMLTEKVATLLGLNADEVHKAIEDAKANAPQTPTAQFQAGIEGATRLVEQAGLAA